MTVVGVLVEAVVGHEHEVVADLVAQAPQRHLHDAVGGVGARAAGVLRRGNAEEDHRGNAEVGERPHLLAQALLGVLHHAGHRGDRLGRVDPLLHEQRRDEVVDRRDVSPRRGARGRSAAQAPRGDVRGTACDQATGAPSRRENGGDETVDVVRIGLDIDVAAARRAVADVIGPIETTTGLRRRAGPTTARSSPRSTTT